MAHFFNRSSRKVTQKTHLFNGSNGGEEAPKMAHLFNRKVTQMARLFNRRNGDEARKTPQKGDPSNRSNGGEYLSDGSDGEVTQKAYLFEGERAVKRLKQTEVDQATGFHFHEEIIVEILVRLPVRSLLQFKCVSKSWKELISGPYFKMKHLNHAKSNRNSHKLLVSPARIVKDIPGSFYCYSLSSFPRWVEDVETLDCPSNCKPLDQKPYCCYDGLSLIGVCDYPGHCRIVLWNPSTRESVVLPPPELPTKGHCTWGLGYDSTTDDYKILKIGHQVYSEILALKSGYWRKIDGHPSGIHPMLSGMDSLAFVHGAFHWLGTSLNYSIASFNITNEAYGEIPLPEEMRLICYEEYAKSGVFVLEEMLCCYSTSYIHGKEGTFKLWVMKDYGVEKSWNVWRIIVSTGLCSAVPKYYVPGVELLYHANMRLYNGCGFRTREAQFGLLRMHNTYHEGFAYTESLISPKLFA